MVIETESASASGPAESDASVSAVALTSVQAAPRIRLPLDQLRTDGGMQPRAGLDQATVEAYAAAMRAGVQFPASTGGMRSTR